jgi:hypothetical protein
MTRRIVSVLIFVAAAFPALLTAQCTVPSVMWPLQTTFDPTHNGLKFGQPWIKYCGGEIKIHTGRDYTTDPGTPVVAAAAGTVVVAQLDSENIGWVTIDHGCFTTVNLHLIPTVAVNDHVNAGDLIGHTGSFPDNALVPHLHFGIRTAPYSNTANRGALPQHACLGDPPFAEHFIDPETVQYYTPPGTGTIQINATFNGYPWPALPGSFFLGYKLQGPKNFNGDGVPDSFPGQPAGFYKLSYVLGGPNGTAPSTITPSDTQLLTAGGTITFTLNFGNQFCGPAGGRLGVECTPPPTCYSLSLLRNDPSGGALPTASPANSSGCGVGQYLASENIQVTSYPSSGWGVGSWIGTGNDASTSTTNSLVMPASNQTIMVNYVQALQNGQPTVTTGGADQITSTSANLHDTVNANGLATDVYFAYGTDVLHSPSYTAPQHIGMGTTAVPFSAVAANLTCATTYSYYGVGSNSAGFGIGQNQTFTTLSCPTSQGTLAANVLLDGLPWQGAITFQVAGPGNPFSGWSVPSSYPLPPGAYTLTYITGGPPGAFLTGVSPSSTQILTAGSAVSFTFNFSTAARGTLAVNASLDGLSWPGAIAYQVSGPAGSFPGTSVPMMYTEATGTYSLQYIAGGPPNKHFQDIVPTSSQNVVAGNTTTFTFRFVTLQPQFSYVWVQATLDGAPWSGWVSAQATGPTLVNVGWAPATIAVSPGTYTLQYSSGGPPHSQVTGYTPSATQSVVLGSTIVFTINFQTVPLAPAVTTAVADGIGTSSATLHALVTPNGAPTSASFDYGTSSAYGSSTVALGVGNTWYWVGFAQTIGRLSCGTTYHYRGNADNVIQVSHGMDQAFTTAPCGPPLGSSFYTVSPCRLLDTRTPGDPNGPALNSGNYRTPTFVGNCGIPAGATAVSMNITVVDHSSSGGFLTLFPEIGVPAPNTSTINFRAGQVRANNAVLPLNGVGSMTVYCAIGAGTVDYIIDVNGYFQ